MAFTNTYVSRPAHGKALGDRIGGVLRAAMGQSILTDALVGGASYDTIAEVKAGILAAANPKNRPWAIKVGLALDKAKAIGLFSETHGATDAAGSLTVSLVGGVTNSTTTVRRNTWS